MNIPPRQIDMRPLIPYTVMGFNHQFHLAIGILVVLQTWKVEDILAVYYATNPEQYNGIIPKWCFIDACYLVSLHIAKTPWLQATKLRTIFLISIAFMFNLSVFVSNLFSLNFFLLTSFFRPYSLDYS
ncbi:hypothetical protein EDC94DRAFT_597244 [Helicostylum pulchrum]|nr:hypothetical protein EDC94DRAFT_597244 [Helicostylum pulchrum]